MCKCIDQLVEKGFVERESVYENQDFVDKGYQLRGFEWKGLTRVASDHVFRMNYCPACGGKIAEK